MINTAQPKISIVTPSFNQSRFLEQTIQSVLHQDYPNLEYVLIDGGSNDNSIDIIRKYESRLSYWISEEDEGHGHALNKGFSQTNGEIMAWINSDDMYTSWSFKIVSEIFSAFPHVMWIVGFNSWWNSDGAMTSASRGSKNIFDYLLGRYEWIQQESVFWRRDLWERAGGYINQDYEFMIDGELWTRFFLYEPLYTVDCILGGYRSHSENRAKHNYADCLREMDRAIAIMKKNCTLDVIETYNKLEILQNLTKHRALRLLISRFGARIYPFTFAAAAYKNIAWQDESWVEMNLPYSI
jgi:glycosyltransferase involved in cell wall biosynthesis